MQEKLLSDKKLLGARVVGMRYSLGRRLVILAINFIPLIHFSLVLGPLFFTNFSWQVRAAISLLNLYLLPVLCSRLVHGFFGKANGFLEFDDPRFMIWWCLSQFESLFSRFGCLEEVLRVVPGLYSTWLRMWGSKIGRLVYWSAGTRILDRAYLDIGNDVVFGISVRLNPHVLRRNPSGKLELILDSVKVEDGALIGGYSLLTAGSCVGAQEATKANLILPPYRGWAEGKFKKLRHDI